MLHSMAKKEKQYQKEKTFHKGRNEYEDSDTLYVCLFPTMVLASSLLWNYILLTISLLKYSFFCLKAMKAMKLDGDYI